MLPATPLPPTDARPTRRRPASVRVLCTVVLLTLALTGCGLRLETPSPAALVPDEIEAVRQRTTADALVLASVARAAAQSGTDVAPELAEALVRVADVSTLHLDALGGIYEPGTDDASRAEDAASPSPSPAPSSTPAASPEQVAAALEETAAVSRADAVTVSDGPLARLLASVTASRLLLADEVRTSADLPRAAAVATEPPQSAPSGPPLSALSALVQSEDAAAVAWEVYTARSDADRRSGPARRARQHRSDAELWARLAEAAGAGADPRRSTYDLPDAIVDPTTPRAQVRDALVELETGLATSYASLVGLTAAGERAPFVDALVSTARNQARTSGAPPALPGLPEQAP